MVFRSWAWSRTRRSHAPVADHHAQSLRHGNVVENRLDDGIGGLSLGFCLVAEDNAMAKDVMSDGLHIPGSDVAPTLQQRPRLGGEGKIDRGTGAGAELD